ncbi:hypothetical protein SAMN04489731_12274 [Amycolatopsis regifaucium]|nr:hypothetical protein SAMN04489731_12274 [Amycolatopsis regifaucium]
MVTGIPGGALRSDHRHWWEGSQRPHSGTPARCSINCLEMHTGFTQ